MRNKYAALWIWLCLLPLAFDYKSPDADTGHLAQVVLVLPAVCGGIALALIAPRFHYTSKLRSWVTGALLLSLGGSVAVQLVRHNELGNYLRVLLPFLLFAMGYLIACQPWRTERIAQFEKTMYYANVVSLVFTFCFGLATAGPIDQVRFRIISVTLLGLQGVILHEFVIAKRFKFSMIVVFLFTAVAELLSVTRSLLLGTILLFLLAAWMSAPSIQHVVRAALRVTAACIVLAAIAASAAWLAPTVAEHWTSRVFVAKQTESGLDPTTITRLAELRDQFDQVTSSTSTLLFGEGYGHWYRYSPLYLPDLAGQISEKDFYSIRDWVAGHNFWVYQLFAGGLLFGIALPAAVVMTLIVAGLAYRRWRATASDALLLPVLGRSILLLAALPAVSIGGNPLGPRFSGLMFGIGLGLTVATYTRLQRELGGRRRRARAPRPVPRGTPPGMEPSFSTPSFGASPFARPPFASTAFPSAMAADDAPSKVASVLPAYTAPAAAAAVAATEAAARAGASAASTLHAPVSPAATAAATTAAAANGAATADTIAPIPSVSPAPAVQIPVAATAGRPASADIRTPHSLHVNAGAFHRMNP
ncbi:MAG: hypothetical protein PW947_21585 [Paraburkholderia sp.]|nr:hypothetical protein [Paraburkholderia sp.]MDE1183025.1 hypothetical protein [Paraburkholderia sp.]